MTLKEWRELKPGDKVWVNPNYFVCPMLGVIKIKGGKKVVWLNLLGDAQFVWGKTDDRNRMLMNLAVYHVGETADEAIWISDRRRCDNCKHCREVSEGSPFCIRRERPVNDLSQNRCMYWTERKLMKLSQKRLNNMNNTEIH